MSPPIASAAGWLLIAAGIWGCDPVDDMTPTGEPSTVMRRLSVYELDQVLNQQFQVVDLPAKRLLPPDVLTPYDNDVAYQEPSALWVESIERLALEVSASVAADSARVEQIMGCDPTGLTAQEAAACVDDVLPGLLRSVWRHEVEPETLEAVRSLLHGDLNASGDLSSATGLLLQLLIQDPELLYRVERTRPDDPDMLDDPSIASRMSFFLWGTGPDELLLDAARDGVLRTSAGRGDAALRMLADPRAVSQAQRLHALWLGYSVLGNPDLIAEIQREEAALLVQRVLFTLRRPWRELLTHTVFPISAPNAGLYGIPNVSQETFGWYDIGFLGRGGIMATTAFMTATSHRSDTSPTLRGKAILERVLCAPPPPPPPNLIADSPPAAGLAPCKLDRYAQHATDPSCATCHAQMDAIGFGLEQYARDGRLRHFDQLPFLQDPNPDCPLPKGASVPGIGDFTNVLELGQLLAATGEPTACMTRQVVDHAFGRTGWVDTDALAEELLPRFIAADERYEALLAHVVAHRAFVRKGAL